MQQNLYALHSSRDGRQKVDLQHTPITPVQAVASEIEPVSPTWLATWLGPLGDQTGKVNTIYI